MSVEPSLEEAMDLSKDRLCDDDDDDGNIRQAVRKLNFQLHSVLQQYSGPLELRMWNFARR